MSTRIALVRRIFWPKQSNLFAVVGAAAGLLTDFVAFLSDHVTPFWPLIGFGIVALGAAVYCFRKALSAEQPITDEKVKAIAECPQCDAFRFGLFSVFAFALALALGQGSTLTEQIGSRLGLIEKKIDTISKQVTDISKSTEQLVQMAQPQMLIEQPDTPEEHFSNAWLYLNVRRDPAAAWNEIQAAYASKAPRKLDSAEMYFSAGKTYVARPQLLENMLRIATEQQDATLLVVAGRNAPDAESADHLYGLARQVDPGLPFAHWDLQRPELQPAGMIVGADARQQQAAKVRSKIAGLEQFLALAAKQPIGSYFYMPQFQPDFEQLARQYMQTYKSSQNMLEADYEAIARKEFEQKRKRQP